MESEKGESNLICSLCAKETDASINEAVKWKLETLKSARAMVEKSLSERENEMQLRSEQLKERDQKILQSLNIKLVSL